MTNWFLRADETGKITDVWGVPEDSYPDGVRVDREPDMEADYYTGELLPRPPMPLSVSGTTISGIPAGSVLTLGEQSFEVDDGEADIDGYSGTVKITCWPYLDAEVVV
jgi:hypothetical protein